MVSIFVVGLRGSVLESSQESLVNIRTRSWDEFPESSCWTGEGWVWGPRQDIVMFPMKNVMHFSRLMVAGEGP